MRHLVSKSLLVFMLVGSGVALGCTQRASDQSTRKNTGSRKIYRQYDPYPRR